MISASLITIPGSNPRGLLDESADRHITIQNSLSKVPALEYLVVILVKFRGKSAKMSMLYY
jgi:hypothetical protein